MPRVKLAVGGWFGASCVIAAALWSCSGSDNDLFSRPSRGGQTSTGGSGTAGGGMSGATSGNGGTPTGGVSGSSTGGDLTGGMPPTGGTSGEGGAAAESGTDSGGTTIGGMGGTAGTGLTSGAGGAGTSGNGGAPMGGMGLGGAGTNGAGTGGAGTGGAGTAGTGGRPPGGCKSDGDCSSTQYCKKSSCDAEEGACTALGPECRGDNAVFAPICGCDGITYWNLCTITHEGFNIASMGECTGNNRPTCTRDDGADSCPPREHAHCYRPVEVCGDPSPDEGVCWVLPTECPDPDDEPQTERYCGGTGGQMRCIGLCEVIDAENSFRRDAPACAPNN